MTRGITVTIVDPTTGELTLQRGERTVRTLESLSEPTSAVAFRRCDDKWLARRVFTDVGLAVPPVNERPLRRRTPRSWTSTAPSWSSHDAANRVGISVDVRDEETLATAVLAAREICDDVLLERYHPGDDLRIIVIGGEVVAASVRRPPRCCRAALA